MLGLLEADTKLLGDKIPETLGLQAINKLGGNIQND